MIDLCDLEVINTHLLSISICFNFGFDFQLELGKMMEQGPVLVIRFQTQQIMVIRDSKNKVVEGDPEKVLRVQHVWVLCRDQTELDPKAAWRLLDVSMSSVEQWL